jgi:hypothetical protein
MSPRPVRQKDSDAQGVIAAKPMLDEVIPNMYANWHHAIRIVGLIGMPCHVF